MLLEIVKLEDKENVLTSLKPGNYTLGRGETLQCNDKRVSRKHIIINVKEDSAEITGIHVNPCFFMAAGSKTIIILQKNVPTILYHDDKFALLPDGSWYQVKYVPNPNEKKTENGEVAKVDEVEKIETITEITETTEPTTNNKRCCDESSDNGMNKKQKSDEENMLLATQLDEVSTNNMTTILEENISNLNATTNEVAEDVSMAVDEIPTEETGDKTEIDKDKNNTKNELVENAINENIENMEVAEEKIALTVNTGLEQTFPQPETSTSNNRLGRIRRERCWYGDKCYRKNLIHKEDFSHPGDSDYASDPEDDRPVCSYGAGCYRTGLQHRAEYKHPSQAPPQKRIRSVVDAKETPEDDYDYDDPFIDDSSDDYLGETDEDYTDTDENYESSTENEEVKRLLREAKGFMKK